VPTRPLLLLIFCAPTATTDPKKRHASTRRAFVRPGAGGLGWCSATCCRFDSFGETVLSREQPAAESRQVSPEDWVSEHGDYLYRFALARVGRPEAAEDLVQETLLAGLKAAPSFAGQSSERTWLTGILKNKLVDRIRQSQRSALLADLNKSDDFLEGLFDRSGHWKVGPKEWAGEPSRILETREFLEAFQNCLARLPTRLREVFSTRVLDEMPPAEICQVLAISSTNLWTLVHRARVRLWSCLDKAGLGLSNGEKY
jgi:RNA polymerase sigma-70 factor (ECF subfamily)